MKYRLIEATETHTITEATRSEIYDVGGFGCDSFSCVAVLNETSIADGSIVLQQSNDAETWVNAASPTTVSADGNVLLEKDYPTARYLSVYMSLSSGTLAATLQILGKGDRDL